MHGLQSSALEALAALARTRSLQQRDDRRARGDGDDAEDTSSVGDTPVDTPAAPQLNASPQTTASGSTATATAAPAAAEGAIPAHYSLVRRLKLYRCFLLSLFAPVCCA